MRYVVALLGTVLFFGLIWLALMAGVIGISYPRSVDNDPLLAPLQVVNVEGDTLELADGRRFTFSDIKPSLSELIAESGNRVDVEPAPYGDFSMIYVKQYRGYCGTPWANAIIIPLFPLDIPVNQRQLLGFAPESRRAASR